MGPAVLLLEKNGRGPKGDPKETVPTFKKRNQDHFKTLVRGGGSSQKQKGVFLLEGRKQERGQYGDQHLIEDGLCVAK